MLRFAATLMCLAILKTAMELLLASTLLHSPGSAETMPANL